jgi:hypothetical protein
MRAISFSHSSLLGSPSDSPAAAQFRWQAVEPTTSTTYPARCTAGPNNLFDRRFEIIIVLHGCSIRSQSRDRTTLVMSHEMCAGQRSRHFVNDRRRNAPRSRHFVITNRVVSINNVVIRER